MASSALSSRLAAIGQEVEERHAREMSELRDRIQKAETERMQMQLSCLKLEANLHDGTARCVDLEEKLRESRDAEPEVEALEREKCGKCKGAVNVVKIGRTWFYIGLHRFSK